ncbi:MAG: CHAP domain-containing protein [Eubacterium sp.]
MKRILRSGIIALAFIIIAATAFPTAVFANENSYEPRLTAPSGEPYYTRELNAYAQSGYGMPNCVAYAYGRIYELNGEAPKISKGNAGSWWFINKYNGYYEYGSEPKLGAVACWSNHVAVVEDISESGAITISESHWGGNYFNTKVYYNMYSHYGQAFYGYIYTYNPSEPEDEKELLYKMEESYFEPQEKNCFTALEFARSNNQIMNPNNNFILNK